MEADWHGPSKSEPWERCFRVAVHRARNSSLRHMLDEEHAGRMAYDGWHTVERSPSDSSLAKNSHQKRTATAERWALRLERSETTSIRIICWVTKYLGFEMLLT